MFEKTPQLNVFSFWCLKSYNRLVHIPEVCQICCFAWAFKIYRMEFVGGYKKQFSFFSYNTLVYL